MDLTSFWWFFWTVSFVVAGGSFAVIAIVVAWRGLADLRKLIEILQGGG